MHVVMSGATGFVGRALLLHLLGEGHEVTAWVRDVERARDELGGDVGLVAVADRDGLAAAVAKADAVVHLAGAPIVGRRWTAKRKRELTQSRVETARALVDAIRARPQPLPVLLTASAVGYYGDRGDQVLDEHAGPGRGFAAELCEAWEAAALEAGRVPENLPPRAPSTPSREEVRTPSGLGVLGGTSALRIVRARIGIVLGRHGGALAQLARVAKLGLGGAIAGGAQWIPWIHLDDVVRAIAHALVTPSLDGAVNVVGPAPVRQREFARGIAEALGRRIELPAPGFALRLALGEAASVLLASQRVMPAALSASGFSFVFSSLRTALHDVLASDHGVAIRRVSRSEVPDAPYLAKHRPRYVLAARTRIAAPLDEVAPFFAEAGNLALLTPPGLGFTILTPRPIAMAAGTEIDYRINVAGLPMRWRTVIERFVPGVGFVDAQHRGPYAAWWHEHRFRRDGDSTIMEDVVYYAPPFGLLGAIANRFVVARMLRDIFAYRAQAIRWRFRGAVTAPQPMLKSSFGWAAPDPSVKRASV